MMKMSELKKGDLAKITKIDGDIKEKRRLLELGITTGQVVKILSISALKKSFLISIRSYALALRKSSLNMVFVEKI